MMRTVSVLLVALTVVATCVTADASEPVIKVIGHPSTAPSSATAADLEGYFLKRVTRWSGGQLCVPVDLPLGTPVREAFSSRFLKRSAKAVQALWQQRIFSGQGVPPKLLADDAAVIAFVAQTPGAIGYVGTATLPDSVRVIAIGEQ